MNENQEYLQRIMLAARNNGLCRTQKEFAALLGDDATSLSSALNGNPRSLTNSLIGKVRNFAISQGLEDGTTPLPKPGGIYLPPETLDLFNNLSETIRLQAEMLAHRPVVQAPQKNYPLDGKWHD